MFRLPLKAEDWFKDIRDSLDYDFDIYYFCLMTGLAKGIKASLPVNETKDIINQFPKGYYAESKIIISIFLKKEIDKMGVNLNDRDSVYKVINKFIKSYSPSNLSEEGQRGMNMYANGGIEVLKEHFGNKPKNIESFLIQFVNIINH